MWATVATSCPVAPRAMIVADDARAARVRNNDKCGSRREVFRKIVPLGICPKRLF
ncbi:hypothetical protein ALC57_06565 [Trachymyrmex cornetzi]|uniref:Uncharacterized protein n=1 Tax=Trachymyrmex cornetzi TaxID=471704 RepID=A0A151J8C3_9HYME|nr:hypothetical protein ALC57_06565 [Trachymyrmex cornetzi]